jgi:prephenate dehydrogenase
MQQTISQIDQDLIFLLSQKIAALKKSPSSEPESSPDSAQLLAEAGIPEFIWQNLMRNCAAAFPFQSSSPFNPNPQKITIVGGNGRMGRFFSARLLQAGHQVNILESNDWEQAEQLLADVNLVLVSVPMKYTVEIIHKLAQYLSPTIPLADITSIKSPIVKAMLEYHDGPVMGLHPMFGPGIESFSSQKVVVCHGRQDRAFQWLLELIESDGGKLIFATPEEHDQIMTTVQAIRNFATLSFGAFLSQENIDIRRSLDISTPIYRQQIDMVTRLFVQSAPLVVDLLLATPERRNAIAKLANVYGKLAQLVKQGDRDALIEEFTAAHRFFAQEVQKDGWQTSRKYSKSKGGMEQNLSIN